MRVGSPRVWFALASAALAIMSAMYGGYAPGAQWPAWMSWSQVWLYGVAALLLAASIGLCVMRTAALSALVIVAYLAAWALLCVPQIVSSPVSLGSWYGFCEALSGLSAAGILYASLRWPSPDSRPVSFARAVRMAQILFGLCCVFYGISHFVYAGYTASMVPNWLPAHLGFALLTGAAHIAAGLGICFAVLAYRAAVLETVMMALFGLLVWVPSFFEHPRPAWAAVAQNQWTELTVNVLLVASAWTIAASLKRRFAASADIAAAGFRPSRAPTPTAE